MICAIVLAAGQSRRMGVQKLLLPYAGKAVIQHIVDQLLECRLDEVFVVVGNDKEKVSQQLANRPVPIVTNPDPQAEMLSSVRCGLQALPQQCQAVLIALGDQPGITTEIINSLLMEFHPSKKGILVPMFQGKRGHPLLFAQPYFSEILNCFDGIGLRGLLDAHPEDIKELNVATNTVLEDMDYPQDYRREFEKLEEDPT